jgi:hypothetical protein
LQWRCSGPSLREFDTIFAGTDLSRTAHLIVGSQNCTRTPCTGRT